jgi:hypothetical protein
MAVLEASNLIDAEHFEKEVIELEKQNEQLKQDKQELLDALINCIEWVDAFIKNPKLLKCIDLTEDKQLIEKHTNK